MEVNQEQNLTSSNQSQPSILPTKIQQLYMDSPLWNLSFITGWRYPIIPRLKGNPLIGRLTQLFTGDGILNNLLQAGKLASQHPSGMCYYWLANQPVLLITQPNHIKEIFVTHEQNVSRRTATRFMEAFWGTSITTDEEALWKEKRAIYAKHLSTTKTLSTYTPAMQLIAKKYLEKIKDTQQQPINFQEILGNYTLEMILSSLIPHDSFTNIKPFSEYTTFVGDNAANIKNIFKWSLPSFLHRFIFKNKSMTPKQIKASMKKTFNELLLIPNEEHIKNTDNFLHSIWDLRKQEAGYSSLTENADVFGDGNALFFAAQDNVTSAIEFSLKLLCANPLVENKLREQLNLHLTNEELTAENINKVDYLEMVIKEVLRLYPPASLLPRGVDKPFTLGNIPLFKGNLVIISPLITHRLANLWENPEQFNPERFSKENVKKIPQHSYLPFGDGKHACVGWRFAYQQIKFILAYIYMNYHVEIENNSFEITIFRTTIRPKNPTLIRFIPIN